MPTSVTSSGITFPDATTQTTAATAANSWTGQKIQVFSSSGTFTVPTGITAVFVQVYGAGAGGQPAGGTTGPGGRGGVGLAYVSGLTPGGTVTVTVGTGGNGATAGNGTSGGSSSFGSYATATGGSFSQSGSFSVSGATLIRSSIVGDSGVSGCATFGYQTYSNYAGSIWPQPYLLLAYLSGMYYPFGGGSVGGAGISNDGMCLSATGGYGGGGGMSGGGGGGSGTSYGNRFGGSGGAVYGPGSAGSNGSTTSSGAGGGAGGSGTASASGGGGGGGGGVIVWW